MANDGAQRVRVSSLIEAGILAINDGYRVKNSELGPVGIPFVRGGDIGDGWIETNVTDHIRPELAARVTSKLTRPGDVAFITKGTVGRVGRIREGRPAVVLAPQVAYWRSLDESKLNSRFLFYLLKGSEFQSNLDAVKTHDSMVADYVSLTDQRLFHLTLPAICEQEQAANILGTLDDKIELNRRMNETLEAMARRLFKSWFVDFDPVHAKAALRREHSQLGNADLSRRALPNLDPKIAEQFPDGFEDSTLGPIPKGWTAGRIGDIAALDKTTVNPSGFPDELLEKIQDVRDRYTDEEPPQPEKSKRKTVSKANAKTATAILFQFKITLLESKPPIWRRIQVQDCTLDKLHEQIQTAMGWTNSHLHQFEIKGQRYGDLELLEVSVHES